MADNLDMQEPEKPRKKKSSGTISMPVFVGSLLGMGLLVAVVVIFVIQYVIKEPATENKNGEKTEQTEEGEEEISELDLEEQEFLEEGKKRKLMEFERITTNPKGSSKYAIISLSITYRPHPGLAEEEFSEGSMFLKKIETKTVNIVSGELRKMDEVSIQNITYEELQERFRALLKDYYRKNKLFLREILITELFVQ